LNIKVIKSEYEFKYQDKRFFLGHGDGLVKKDTGYKILKKILRIDFFSFYFYLIHPDLGISIGKKTSKTSREYTDIMTTVKQTVFLKRQNKRLNKVMISYFLVIHIQEILKYIKTVNIY
jgi:UDP-2,3-diacylglucosamine hydrolase